MAKNYGIFHHEQSGKFYLIPDNVDLEPGRYKISDLKDHSVLVRQKDVVVYEKKRTEIIAHLRECVEANILASKNNIVNLYQFSKKFDIPGEENVYEEEQQKSFESMVYSILGISKESVEKNSVAAKAGMEKIQSGFEEFMNNANLEWEESESAKEILDNLTKTFDSFEKKVQTGLNHISEKIENFLNDEKTEQFFKDWASSWNEKTTNPNHKQEIKNKIENFTNQFLKENKGNDAPKDT